VYFAEMIRRAIILLSILQACGGDTNNGTDASTDGTTGSDALSDVAQQQDVVQGNDGGCPTYTGNVAFCKASIDRCNACPGSLKLNSCQRQSLDALCNAVDNLFSAQYAAAVESCATICDTDASDSCQKAALADASLTTAQQKLITDYCGRCGVNQNCGSQLAGNVAQYADPIVTSIDQACVPDAGGPDSGACLAFGNCASGHLQSALAALPCADAASD